MSNNQTLGKNNIKQEILDKEFSVEYKGYASNEVDEFFDYIINQIKNLEDNYQIVIKQWQDEVNKNENLKKEISLAKNELSLLKEQKQALEAKGLENVDIITRLSKLENIVNDD